MKIVYLNDYSCFIFIIFILQWMEFKVIRYHRQEGNVFLIPNIQMIVSKKFNFYSLNSIYNLFLFFLLESLSTRVQIRALHGLSLYTYTSGNT